MKSYTNPVIRDPLYRQIREALDSNLDPDTFQLAAAALLRDDWPTLVPISGGKDAGQDARTAGPDPVFLVATTSPRALANLRKNLLEHRKKNRPGRRVIFATNRKLSEGHAHTLETTAQELGYTLHQSYPLDWFTGALYKNPDWRRRLLDVPGDMPSLSVVPPSRWPASLIPLIGRDEELRRLRSARGDGVIVGVPGIGKSELLRRLAHEDWGLFVTNYDLVGVADAIREQGPSRVILDDAQFAIDSVTELRRVRELMDEGFAIIAVTWPGSHARDVASCLPGSWHLALQGLTRDEILEIVKAFGVRGPLEFQRAIVNQANTRPGLAATLAFLAISGQLRDVATGDALFERTRVICKRLAGDWSSSMLGVMALSGSTGIDLEVVADILRITLPEAQKTLADLASGGIISETWSGSRQLVVQPEELRFAAVKQTFFGGPSSLSPSRILRRLPHPYGAAIPLIAARHRGAPVPDDLIGESLTHATDRESWTAFSTLGLQQAQFALEQHPEHAVSIGAQAITHSPKFGYSVLLDEAAKYVGPSNQLGDAMTSIRDWAYAGKWKPTCRDELVDAVKEWCEAGGSLSTAMKALRYALDPGWEDHNSDAGAGMTISISNGVVTEEALHNIAGHFAVLLDLVKRYKCENYSPLFEILGEWCYPGRLVFARPTLPAGYREFARTRVAETIAQLVEIFRRHPGVIHRLAQTARQARLGLVIEEDPEFSLLFPDLNRRKDYQTAYATADRAIARHAKRVALTIPPDEVMRSVSTMVRFAKEADLSDRDVVYRFFVHLATESADGLAFVRSGIAHSIEPDLLYPFLAQDSARQSERMRTLQELLADDRYYRIAVFTCLTTPVPNRLLRRALRRCDESMRGPITTAAIRSQLTDPATRGLLMHSNSKVAFSTARGLHRSSTSLAPSLDELWQSAVLNAPLDLAHEDWILDDRPDLIVRWILNCVTDPLASMTFGIRDRVSQRVSRLPREKRREVLVESFGRSKSPPYPIVEALIAGEVPLMEILFDDDRMQKYRYIAVRGPVTRYWLAGAYLALDHGWTMEDIIKGSDSGVDRWGEDSDHFESLVQAFACLAIVPDQRARAIAEEGIIYFAAQRDQAIAAEKRELMY